MIDATKNEVLEALADREARHAHRELIAAQQALDDLVSSQTLSAQAWKAVEDAEKALEEQNVKSMIDEETVKCSSGSCEL